MCGIFGIVSNAEETRSDTDKIQESFMRGQGRGPEETSLTTVTDTITFGFHRLAINGYKNPDSSQPLRFSGCILIMNGEIYNYKELHESLGCQNTTGSDCEILIHLYKRYGMKQALQSLLGVFAFLLYDTETQSLFIGRDPRGVRPLFMSDITHYVHGTTSLYLSSELKMIHDLTDAPIHQYPPGTFTELSDMGEYIDVTYHTLTHTTLYSLVDEELVTEYIQTNVYESIQRRVDTTDRPIACLLSGGLDSSLICAILSTMNLKKPLHTYSIGMKGSEDLKCARRVTEHLKISHNHHCLEVNPCDFINAIPDVIKCIESYDTTTVRASVGNFLISKYISETSDAKVIFTGEGADELMGGYLYFHYAPTSKEFDNECRRLLTDIHLFDGLRCDRCISHHGLEARIPFLDVLMIDHYLMIPSDVRATQQPDYPEKYLLRRAFSKTDLLPDDILWRRKEAFSDGVSHEVKPWYQMIQEYAQERYDKAGISLSLVEAEKKYYKDIFDSEYPTRDTVIPYLWMPQWVTNDDPSAITLSIYKD